MRSIAMSFKRLFTFYSVFLLYSIVVHTKIVFMLFYCHICEFAKKIYYHLINGPTKN